MTLKEKLEILRGEPIDIFDGNPLEIPCIEVSDTAKLCKHPVVSVQMITYNHEPFIQQAIEGVMMQQTDFEFELVIGEDCSQDKTREICLEYQKRYSDKIRVLWWHENVSRLGGNARRVLARSRGEYIAFCEGDDYWTDPLKLQKQVDVMRQHNNVGLCFGTSDSRDETSGNVVFGESYANSLFIMPGAKFNAKRGCGTELRKIKDFFKDSQIRTLTALCRTSVLREVMASHADVFSWRLHVGDFLKWMMLATVSDVAFLPDTVGVYRIHAGGITSRKNSAVGMDCYLLVIFFNVSQIGASLEKTVDSCGNFIDVFWDLAETRTFCSQIRCAWNARKLPFWKNELKEYRLGLFWTLLNCGLLHPSIVTTIDGLPAFVKGFFKKGRVFPRMFARKFTRGPNGGGVPKR